jgi:hypothetical protein
VECGLGRCDCGKPSSVVCRRIALSKVVGLDLCIISAESFPINLVQIIALEDNGGHNAGAGGHLHNNIDVTEEDVVVGLDGGGVSSLGDRKLGTQATIRYVPVGNVEGRALSFREVDYLRASKCGIGRASYSTLAPVRFDVWEVVLFVRGSHLVKV